MAQKKDTTLISLQSKQLHILRKKEGLSQAELAARLGRTQTTVQRYESGEIPIPTAVVHKLHELFGMSFEWFYAGKGKRQTEQDKRSLLQDIADLSARVDLLTHKLESIEREMMATARELYAMKHNG